MRKVNWQQYEYCETCDQAAGSPCRDTRYATKMGVFFMNKPHKGRKRISTT